MCVPSEALCSLTGDISGYDNGCLLYGKDKLLKFRGQTIFVNTREHPATGQEMSMPPSGPDYAQWSVPDKLKDDIRVANEAILGTAADPPKLEQYRICW